MTTAVGSYIYPDVAVGPDGRVFVTWWDYSSDNAIEGAASSNGGASFGPQTTIALLDQTGGRPLPFGCPILVQPGGRVGPAPGVEVDRSLGPHRGRVYVSWGDLRPGSGTTRCEELPNGTFTPPLATHLSWDGFVASSDGDLPGSAAASAGAGTRLFTDGTGGDPTSSDEFFPWLAVDQATGDVWADFYSTRDDATRRTTHFYARSVAPDGSGGHDLGPLERLSTASSSYATNPCCTFGNDFGDYEALAAARCVPLPAWSDNSSGTPRDGEAFTFDSLRGPVCFQDVPALTEGPGADGDGRLEPGEAVTVAVPLRNAGTGASTAVTGALTQASAGATVTEGSASWPAIPAGGTADPSQAFPGAARRGGSVPARRGARAGAFGAPRARRPRS